MATLEAKTCKQYESDYCRSGICMIRCNIEYYRITGDPCKVSEHYKGTCNRGVAGCNVFHPKPKN